MKIKLLPFVSELQFFSKKVLVFLKTEIREYPGFYDCGKIGKTVLGG